MKLLRWGAPGSERLWGPAHLKLTCDQEVGEDQEAAAAEADGTVGGSERGQEEETAGQFTNTQHRRSFQHTIHGYNKTHTHAGQGIGKTGSFCLRVEERRNARHSADSKKSPQRPTMLNISVTSAKF